MGSADETRHMVMKARHAVVSPGWSIPAGVGTQAYSFCWGVGGENQDDAEMDPAPVATIRRGMTKSQPAQQIVKEDGMKFIPIFTAALLPCHASRRPATARRFFPAGR